MPLTNIRVPPDSTGKRVVTHKTLQLPYESGTIDFEVSEIVVGATSGAQGTVTRIDGSTSIGTIWLVFRDSDDPITDFLASEALQVSGVTKAFASSSGTEGHVQKVVLAGGDNPFHEQRVDSLGAAHVRFSEGNPQFTAFGEMRVSKSTSIAKYSHVYSDLEGPGSDSIYTDTSGTGSAIRNADTSDITLQVDTANGDRVTRTTNRYHIYTPGSAQLAEMSIAMGDAGKSNVARRWGLFDDDNGLFFQLSGTTFSVVIRSNTTGSIVNTSVDQADFNSDVLDGSNSAENPSGVLIDLTKANLYWIDYQWLGVGQVRFGIFTPNGDRIIAHTFKNPNNNTTAYMGTGTLPLRWEIENTGATGSISEMRAICSTVQAEGFDPNEKSIRRKSNAQSILGTSVSSTEIPIISFRPAATYGSKENRNPILLSEIGAYTTQPALLRIRKNATIGGGTSWTSYGEFTEYDVSSTTTSGGDELYSHLIVNGGQLASLDLKDYFNYLHEYLCLRADGSQTNTYTITAERVTGTDASVSIAVNWWEVLT